MSNWIIEPRDPLIARDGRPFGPVPGARAASLSFPFPSTIAGGVRTRLGLNNDGIFDSSLILRLKRIGIRGPLLVELNDEGDINDSGLLCPAPLDALLFEGESEDKNTAYRKRLVPLRLPSGGATNLTAGLAPVGLVESDSRKPHGRSPRFWHWEQFLKWLQPPAYNSAAEGEAMTLRSLGHNGLTSENRTHVGIEPAHQSAIEGALFQTRGLEFTMNAKLDDSGKADLRRMALMVVVEDQVDAEGCLSIKGGLAPLGGERRLVNWRQSQATLPECPSALLAAIVRTKCCRLVLLTPAHFEQGSTPRWLTEPRNGVAAQLSALVIGRAEVVSGWDLQANSPKPTRRLAPAGTTMFLKLDGDAGAVEKWVTTTWMQNISDDDTHRRDGFGLCALGVWDGIFQEME